MPAFTASGSLSHTAMTCLRSSGSSGRNWCTHVAHLDYWNGIALHLVDLLYGEIQLLRTAIFCQHFPCDQETAERGAFIHNLLCSWHKRESLGQFWDTQQQQTTVFHNKQQDKRLCKYLFLGLIGVVACWIPIPGSHEVWGSIPRSSTQKIKGL